MFQLVKSLDDLQNDDQQFQYLARVICNAFKITPQELGLICVVDGELVSSTIVDEPIKILPSRAQHNTTE